MQDNINLTAYSIGEIKDIIRDARTGEVIEERDWSKNVIVTNLAKLVATLLKCQAGYTGISYWAVGSGLESWDNQNPPAPSSSDTGLVTEIGRKAIPVGAMVYLDADNNTVAGPTNKIMISLTFSESDCNGTWREFGIVGGDASATPNSGIFVNHKTHALIAKSTSIVVERKMRFTFTTTAV